MIGKTMKTHTCASQSPPPKIAVAMERAGLIEALSIGIAMSSRSVSVPPMAMGAKPAAARVGDPEDDEQEDGGDDDLDHDRRDETEPAWRELTETVGDESTGDGRVEEAVRPTSGQAEDRERPEECTDQLGDDERPGRAPRESTGSRESERHSRVEVSTGDGAEGVGADRDREAERDRDTEETDTERVGRLGPEERGERRSADEPEDQQEGSGDFGEELRRSRRFDGGWDFG